MRHTLPGGRAALECTRCTSTSKPFQERASPAFLAGFDVLRVKGRPTRNSYDISWGPLVRRRRSSSSRALARTPFNAC